MADEDKPKQAVVQKVYTLDDMGPLNQQDHYSAFGKMQMSHKPTEPKIGFGRETREKREKVFQSKENMKAFLGMHRSPRQEHEELLHRDGPVQL